MVNTGGDRWPDRARQDYLKAIYLAGGGAAAKAAHVARRLGVSRASVSKRVRELERDKLIARSAGDQMLHLTRSGRRLALGVVRRHRIVETFLHGALGVPLDRLHAEAERIEHAVSDDIAARLERLLQRPARDPHGDAIPDERLRVARVIDVPLPSAAVGERLRVSRIDDRQPPIVRALVRARVLPGVGVCVVKRGARAIVLRVGTRLVALPPPAAAAVRVTPAQAAKAWRSA